jgi:DNA-binding NtrC family response regulator
MMAGSETLRLLLLGDPGTAGDLEGGDVEVHCFTAPEELLRRAAELGARACVLCPGVLEGSEAIGDFVRRLRREVPFTDVVAWEPLGDAATVRELLVNGARDVVIEKGPDELLEQVRQVVESQRYLPRMLRHSEDMAGKWRFEGMLSRSQKMHDVFEVCVRTAATDATVLILGETGTGKELLARAFHRRSERAGRLVVINCSAVPESLIDSELFGHERGAFTGAERSKQGLFRYADGGTLFLDEIGSIPLPVQYRLLRVLQVGKVRPVGSDREMPVDARVVAATSVHLDEEVAAGRFREDLLYRLDVIRVVLPPLRERPEDILFLFGHFMRRLLEHHGLPRPDIRDEFLDGLQAHDWPGNVRQLENLTERLLLTHPGSEPLIGEDFRKLVEPLRESTEAAQPMPGMQPDLDVSLPEAVDAAAARTEKAYLLAVMQRTSGRVLRAAELAGVSRRTLLRKLTKHDIDKRAFRQAGEA